MDAITKVRIHKLMDIYESLIKLKINRIKETDDYRLIKEYEKDIDDLIEKMKDL